MLLVFAEVLVVFGMWLIRRPWKGCFVSAVGLGLGWGGGSVDVLESASYVVDVTLKVLSCCGVGDLLTFLIARLRLLMLR